MSLYTWKTLIFSIVFSHVKKGLKMTGFFRCAETKLLIGLKVSSACSYLAVADSEGMEGTFPPLKSAKKESVLISLFFLTFCSESAKNFSSLRSPALCIDEIKVN